MVWLLGAFFFICFMGYGLVKMASDEKKLKRKARRRWRD